MIAVDLRTRPPRPISRQRALTQAKMPVRFRVRVDFLYEPDRSGHSIKARCIGKYQVTALTPAGARYFQHAIRNLIESLDSVQLVPSSQQDKVA